MKIVNLVMILAAVLPVTAYATERVTKLPGWVLNPVPVVGGSPAGSGCVTMKGDAPDQLETIQAKLKATAAASRHRSGSVVSGSEISQSSYEINIESKSASAGLINPVILNERVVTLPNENLICIRVVLK